RKTARRRAHLTFVEPARGVAQTSNLSVSRELHHLARFFRRWRLREASGVRGACSRFRVSNHQRKRQQAGRTPYASRGSVAAVPRCAVSPIFIRQERERSDWLLAKRVLWA